MRRKLNGQKIIVKEERRKITYLPTRYVLGFRTRNADICVAENPEMLALIDLSIESNACEKDGTCLTARWLGLALGGTRP